MRSVIAVGILASVLFIDAAASEAAFETGCCACIAHSAHSGSAAGRPQTDALFCQLVEGEGFPAFVERCNALGGSATTDCPEPLDGADSCPVTLSEELNIACPASQAAAPTVGPLMLGALAAGLGAAGFVVLRRRRA